MPDEDKTTPTEVFVQLYSAGMLYATSEDRERVLAALSIEPSDLAKCMAMTLVMLREQDVYPDISDQLRPGTNVHTLFVDASYWHMVIGISLGLKAQGSMEVTIDPDEARKIVSDELAKRNGRLGKTKLVRNRRNNGRRLR